MTRAFSGLLLVTHLAILAGLPPGSPFGGGGSGGGGGTLAGNNTWTGANTFSQVITSTVASGQQAFNMVGGAKGCYNASCSSIVQDDGFGTMSLAASGGISTSARLTLSAGDLQFQGAAGTAGSGTGITTNNTGVVRSVIHKITVARTALTAAATTQDVTIWTVPAKERIVRVIADTTAAFDDAAGPISAVTITCGKTAGGNEYIVSGSVFAVSTLGDASAEMGASLSGGVGDIPSWTATTAVQCRWTATGGNLSTLTTGSDTFYIEGLVYP